MSEDIVKTLDRDSTHLWSIVEAIPLSDTGKE